MVCGCLFRPVLKKRRRLDKGHSSGSGCLQRFRQRLWLPHRTCGRTRLQVTSPCEGSVVREADLGSDGAWSTFCPVCKRPLELALRPAPRGQPERLGRGKYAYVVALWGESPSYILGSMVLGKSLRATGTPHDLVVLHTNSVPSGALQWLSRAGWKLHETKVIYGVSQLYNHGEPRFQGVFTKLQVLGLVEYEKILLLDIDTLVLKSMDSLFDLPAPAAMGRGPQDCVVHGEAIDGSGFFSGARTFKAWGQSWGINAGVMLMRPDEEVLQQMLYEVQDSCHPSHIRGNGPEQDYLSRYWADRWTHIGVEYNFQMHQMYHVLHPVGIVDRRTALMEQFVQDPSSSEIRLMHYSGPLKPWSSVLDAEYSRDNGGEEAKSRFLRDVLESFNGYWLWVKRDVETVRHQGLKEGVTFGPDGSLHWIDWSKVKNGWSAEGDAVGGDETADMDTGDLEEGAGQRFEPGGAPFPPAGESVGVPEALCRAAELVVSKALDWWDEAYRALEAELGCPGLAAEVARACAPPGREEEEEDRGEGTPLLARAGPPPEEKPGWSSCGGWWVDRPVLPRASALAGCAPEPFVTFSLGCRALLDIRGSEAAGVHALAVRDDGSGEDRLDGAEAGAAALWAARAPAAALVFVAVVGLARDAVADLLVTLRRAGIAGIPTEPAPKDCTVLVALGRKGDTAPFETMAAADFALATRSLEPAATK